ncbi:MAG TPA: type IV pilus assembly protein PilM [Fimbriimonadaceae bacterium]|nr:type IV pilus assembly protein PilM [Fimbriimonadaceae bacterium]
MGFSPFKKRTYVGLDLGHHTLKAVQLERSGAGWKVGRIGWIKTPQDCIKESVVIDPEMLGAAIKELLRNSHITANTANIAVAGGSVVVRNVRIPKMPETTLRKSIKYEASRYVPSSVEESYIEFEILREAEENQMDVLIVAAPREVVESRIKACEYAGLAVENVDVETFAAYRSLVESDTAHDWTGRTIALIDVGAASASLSVVRDGEFVITRSLPNGGQVLTEALKNYFKLEDDDAETGKSQLNVMELIGDQPKENPPLRVLQPHVDDFVREIRRSLNYYQSQQGQTENPNVDALIVSGGGAKLPGITEYVAAKLGLEALSSGIFDNPRFHGANESFGRGLELSVASGLAMRAFGRAA